MHKGRLHNELQREIPISKCSHHSTLIQGMLCRVPFLSIWPKYLYLQKVLSENAIRPSRVVKEDSPDHGYSYCGYRPPSGLATGIIQSLLLTLQIWLKLRILKIRGKQELFFWFGCIVEKRSFLSYYFLLLLSRSFLTRDDPLPPRIAGLRIPHAM